MINSVTNNYYNSYGLFDTGSSSKSNSSNNIFSAFNGSSSSIYDLIGNGYAQNNAKKSTSYATSTAVKTAGSDIYSLLSSLTKKGTKSLFNEISAASSNEKAATATVDNSKLTDKSKLKPVELNIQQIAKEQINSGTVKAKDKAVSSGIYSFEVKVGDKAAQSISINVSAADNNESIQKKMAQAINDKKLGVTASVSLDGTKQNSTLSITSNTTGTSGNEGEPVFTITDKSGNLAQKMGATNITQYAQNAVYAVDDGQKQYSTSNKIDLGNGVTATLKDAGSTNLTFKQDGTNAIDKVKELVSSLNDAMRIAAEGTDRGSSRLLNDIYNMNTAYASTLKNAGVEVASNGVLSVDEDKLKAAAENGNLSKLFQENSSYGFANRAERIADNMKSSQYYASPVESYSYDSYGVYDKYSATMSLFDSFF